MSNEKRRRRGRSRPNGGESGRRFGAARERSHAPADAPKGRAHARLGRGAPEGHTLAELCELSPFSVFCALHLGITERNGYANQDARSVARRFSLSCEELDAYLCEHAIDAESLRAAGFERESARLDMQVAPEGISRTELARTLFEELRKPELA
jgi:hypothetical protein